MFPVLDVTLFVFLHVPSCNKTCCSTLNHFNLELWILLIWTPDSAAVVEVWPYHREIVLVFVTRLMWFFHDRFDCKSTQRHLVERSSVYWSETNGLSVQCPWFGTGKLMEIWIWWLGEHYTFVGGTLFPTYFPEARLSRSCWSRNFELMTARYWTYEIWKYPVGQNVPYHAMTIAHTSFVLLDVTCSPYGINRMDLWSNIWACGPPPPTTQTTNPLSYLNFFFCNIKYF